MTRKVALTGIMIFFRPGSVQQLLVGGTIASFYMAAAATKRPFVSRFDNNFKIATDGAIIVTFNIAVMLNLNDRVSDDAISRLAAADTTVSSLTRNVLAT